MDGRLKFFVCGMMMCMSVFLTACSTGASNNNNNVLKEDKVLNESDTSGVTKEREWVYVPEVFVIGDRRADYEDMQIVGDTVCYVTMNGEAGDEAQSICQYALSDKSLTRAPIAWPMEGSCREVYAYVFLEDFSAWVIVNVYPADFSKMSRFLCKFDPEGKITFYQDVTEQLGRGISISVMDTDTQGRIYVFTVEAGICLYGNDGSYQGSISYGSEDAYVRQTVNGADDKFYACISEGENAKQCTLTEVDFEKRQLIEVIKELPDISGLCVDSTGQYDLLLYDDIFVYGYRFPAQKGGAGQATEELFVWADSDVNGYFVRDLCILEDGRYYVKVVDWMHDDTCVVLLDKTRAEDAPKRENVVLAAVNGGSELAALAVRFNRGNSRWHLTVKNYDSLTDLYNAMLARQTMDIIDLSGVDVEKLSKQGIFEDLNPYLEQSEIFDHSDFVDGILEAYTFDGTLVGIPQTFTMQTIMGDRTQIGNAAGLTLEGLLAAAGRNPQACPFDGPYDERITKEEMMQYIMMFNEDVFIDWDTGKCHFDSETFKAVLELVNHIPDSQGYGQEEASLTDRIRNGDVLFGIVNINELKDVQRYRNRRGENAVCIGFPTIDGKGGTLLFGKNAFGIVAGSENKSGAWEFVESVLESENVDQMEPQDVAMNYEFIFGLPVQKKIMNILIEYRLEEEREWAAKDHGYEFHPLTRDEVDVVLDLLKEATPAFSVENDDIVKIINEEAPAYYSGQKRVEDVVSLIQNRIQLYVNENHVF